MISKKFKNEIKEFKKDLFYNEEGNTDAYRLCVRHLSYAPTMGLGIILNKNFIPTNEIYLVDFKKEIIYELEDKIKLIQLTELK